MVFVLAKLRGVVSLAETVVISWEPYFGSLFTFMVSGTGSSVQSPLMCVFGGFGASVPPPCSARP